MLHNKQSDLCVHPEGAENAVWSSAESLFAQVEDRFLASGLRKAWSGPTLTE